LQPWESQLLVVTRFRQTVRIMGTDWHQNPDAPHLLAAQA
jgi:hypothetical protein